jgi:uncharacterized protein (TIGR02145 family)
MKTQNRIGRSSIATKSIFLAILLALIGTSNLAYAAGQNDFYGVWKWGSGDFYGIKRFYEINNGTIIRTLISNSDVYKDKYRIVKWESWSKGYNIYTLDEKNLKIEFKVRMDAYGDVSIKEEVGKRDEFEMEKSSTAELNKAILAAEKAKKAATEKAAAEAEVVFKEKIAGSFTDSRDGKTYKTVKLRNQTWMAENLNYNANGSKCYENQESNCAKYGRFYDWSTAKSACPKGWHLPSDNEWQTLVDLAGGKGVAGKALKASSGWNNNGNGVDVAGFSALPGGGYEFSDGSFDGIGSFGAWWSATEYNAHNAYYRAMEDTIAIVDKDHSSKSDIGSVRCVQD